MKIVLDADVIIHFSKGGYLSLLPQIFPEYEYVVLDRVYNELRSVATLKLTFGDGESACSTICGIVLCHEGFFTCLDWRRYLL